eukprot:CAMPEP_0172318128 /NCGR_PEP_ID=MMETSP1058-20130122/33941_1 /TAXON_ID=83371 /ORGANISM="Detonula confervacea, Strain CCMP 353" /LENGTH=140 /DNA_ID=CAMNT_0013032871 /DNA_START=60 /DNA_END=482 /DNA_ORIENTATION=-
MATRSNSRPNSRQSNGHAGGMQHHGQMKDSNPTKSSRGRSVTRHPSNMAMMHNRARSSSKARQRKKKGTLVMRGGHDDDEDDGECRLLNGLMNGKSMHGKTSNGMTRDPSKQHDNNMSYDKSKARVIRESRNPPSSMYRC